MSAVNLLRRLAESELANVSDAGEVRALVERLNRPLGDLAVDADLCQRMAEDLAAWLEARPTLQLDWGTNLRVGLNLAPKFHVRGARFRSKPDVALPRDPLLDCPQWKECPDLQLEEPAHWSFSQVVRLTQEGVYRLELRAVFEEGATAYCYRSDVELKVVNTRQAAGPSLQIDAEGAGVVDMPCQDLAGFSNVTVRVSGQGLTRIRGPGWEGGSAPGQRPPDEFVIELPLRPDHQLQTQMPLVAPHGTRYRADAASLVFADGRRIQVLARRALLGRKHDPAPAAGQDHVVVVLRLDPLDAKRAFLTQRISRDHFFVELRPEGLRITDAPSALGTFLDDQPIEGSRTLAPAELFACPHQIDVGGILSLELTGHADRTWDALKPCEQDLLERRYCRVASAAINPVWDWAQQTHIDAVRLRRRRRLPVRKYLSYLVPKLGTALGQQLTEYVRGDAIELDDPLAGREQYVLLFRAATIGGAESDPIVLSGAGLAPAHARLLHLDGSFWLEHLDRHPGKITLVDGQPLAVHELVPLSPGARLRFGTQEIVFDQYQRVTA